MIGFRVYGLGFRVQGVEEMVEEHGECLGCLSFVQGSC